MKHEDTSIRWFETLARGDVAIVGGKNASLGEMVQTLAPAGIAIPPGFATTADAYWQFIDGSHIRATIAALLADWDAGRATLAETGDGIRSQILRGTWPEDLAGQIARAYAALCKRAGKDNVDVAVRSSATAEDLPDASFAGQQETFLNIRGESGAARRLPALLCLALHRPRDQLPHRQGLRPHEGRALDRRAADGALRPRRRRRHVLDRYRDRLRQGGADQCRLGPRRERRAGHRRSRRISWSSSRCSANPVLVPIIEKTPRRARRIKMIYAASGERPTAQRADLEEPSAQAFVLSDAEILHARALGRASIERITAAPMDMEWAKDGENGRDVHRPGAARDRAVARATRARCERYHDPQEGAACSPRASRIGDADRRGPGLPDRERRRTSASFVDGAILVTETTDPDWVPIMKRAAAIVTDHGGRTSHAAIVSRELGLPAIVGTGNATELLHDGQEVTVSCAEGDAGLRLRGHAPTSKRETLDLDDLPATAHQGHAEPRQPGGGVPLVAPAGRRRRPRAHGVRHQQRTSRSIRWRWSLRHARRTRAPRRTIADADRGLRRQDRVFRRSSSRAASARIAAAALPEAGHRADERLQDQRICRA